MQRQSEAGSVTTHSRKARSEISSAHSPGPGTSVR